MGHYILWFAETSFAFSKFNKSGKVRAKEINVVLNQ